MDQDLSTDIYYTHDDYNQAGGGSEESESLNQYIMKIANAVKNSESLDTDIKNKIGLKKNITKKNLNNMIGGNKKDGVIEVTESIVTTNSLSDMISEMSGASKSMGSKTITNNIPINYSEQESNNNNSKNISLSLSERVNSVFLDSGLSLESETVDSELSLESETADSVFLDSELSLDSDTSFKASTTSEISFIDLNLNKSKNSIKNIKKTNKKRISKMKHKFNNRFTDI